MESSSGQLSWSLVIPTYCREDVLPKTLGYAASQSRKPKEIIIVDSSPNAEETRRLIEDEFAVKYPDVEMKYILSSNRSAAVQRNEGIVLCTGDIVFFIDDDCFMYPAYAEVILHVYEADTSCSLVGVGGMLDGKAPDEASYTGLVELKRPLRQRIPAYIKFRCWHVFSHLLLMNTSLSHFHPFTGSFPELSPPKLDLPYRIEPSRLYGAGRATFRRKSISKIMFDEGLTHYCAGEDLDVCYRLSQTGPLVVVFDAKVYHLAHPSTRLDHRTIALIRVTNHAYFIQKNNPCGKRVKLGYLVKLCRRLLANFLQDVLAGNGLLPRTRGALAGVGPTMKIFNMPPEKLVPWYITFQNKVYEEAQKWKKHTQVNP